MPRPPQIPLRPEAAPRSNAKSKTPDPRFSVAPMHGWTTKACRHYYRMLSKQALLYTEMIAVPAFLQGRVGQTPVCDAEGSVALQLAGSDPNELARACKLAACFGYREVNLNLGCPSPRVQALGAGALLFRSPERVCACLEAMREASSLPVSLKMRTGVDELDDLQIFLRFIETTHLASGITVYQIHARKAWLKGLSPAQNRSIPPLTPEWVYQAKKTFPHLTFVLNGGLQSLESARAPLRCLDGVMLGRAVYHNPWMLSRVDSELFDDPTPGTALHTFLDEAESYFQTRLPFTGAAGLLKPLFNLFTGHSICKSWKRALTEKAAHTEKSRATSLLAIYKKISEAASHAPFPKKK